MNAKPDIADPPARILIVDDERPNRQLLEILLTPEGFRLRSAASGEEALALIREEPPDLVLLDVMMPGLDGYQVAKRIKSNPATQNIPIIMVSALDDRASRMLGLTAGAEDFLTKPVDRGEVTVRVRNLLRLKAYGDYHDKYSRILEGEVGSRSEELVESERRFRQLAETIPEVFFLVDAHMDRMYYVSPAYEIIFGRSCQSLYNDAQSWIDCVHPDDRKAMLQEMAPYGTFIPFDTEYRIVRPDGSERSIRARGSPIRDTAGEAFRFAGIAEDITERKTLEAQVRQAGKMDAIGQLAAGVAHDFNNLLSVVLSYSELLTEGLKEGDPMLDDLNEIKGAGLRAAELTRQLLAFSRKQVLQPKVVDLGAIVGGMEKMLRRLIGEDIELSVVGAVEPCKALVDPGQMEQVLLNLAVNARDAMPRGGKLTVETKQAFLDEAYVAKHGGAKPGPHVMLAVSDTGVGMDRATQARIFEPFFTTKGVGKGTGLGLATVFGIVKQSGGTIFAYSEPNVGTTFKVYLPAADQAAAVTTLPPAGPVQQPSSLRGAETILLAEDDEHVRILTRTILRKYGYNVLEAQSGGDAFLICEQHTATIHLLLTDVVMPRMSGRELAERLLKVRPEMKVLYMSGYTDDAVMRHGILESTVAFVQKPIAPEKLARKIRQVLDAVRSS